MCFIWSLYPRKAPENYAEAEKNSTQNLVVILRAAAVRPEYYIIISSKSQRHFFIKIQKVFAIKEDFSAKNPFAIFENLWYNIHSA